MSKRKKNQLSKIQRTASEPAVAPGHLAGASAETRVPQSAPVATVADTHASGPAPSEVELPEAAVPGSETPESGPTPTTSGAPPVRRQKKVSVAPTRTNGQPQAEGPPEGDREAHQARGRGRHQDIQNPGAPAASQGRHSGRVTTGHRVAIPQRTRVFEWRVDRENGSEGQVCQTRRRRARLFDSQQIELVPPQAFIRPPGSGRAGTVPPEGYGTVYQEIRMSTSTSQRASTKSVTHGMPAPIRIPAGIGDQPFQRLEAATKKSTLVALLERPTGATLGELAAATGWQCHSVRGFLSGTLTKMGRPVTSTKRADGTPEGVTATICVSFKSSTQHRADSDCQGKVSQPSQRGDVPAGDRSRCGIKMRRASSTISERQTFSIRPETFA